MIIDEEAFAGRLAGPLADAISERTLQSSLDLPLETNLVAAFRSVNGRDAPEELKSTLAFRFELRAPGGGFLPSFASDALRAHIGRQERDDLVSSSHRLPIAEPQDCGVFAVEREVTEQVCAGPVRHA